MVRDTDYPLGLGLTPASKSASQSRAFAISGHGTLPSGKCPASTTLMTALMCPSRRRLSAVAPTHAGARLSCHAAATVLRRGGKGVTFRVRLVGERLVQHPVPDGRMAHGPRPMPPGLGRRPGRREQVIALVEWMLVLASPVIASSTLAMSPRA